MPLSGAVSTNDTDTVIAELKAALGAFNAEREWEQFHSAKDLAMALSVEAAELLELFLWRDVDAPVALDRAREELADVFITALNLASRLDIDVAEAVRAKMALNAQRYPVALSKGNARKHDQLTRDS